MSTIKVCDRCGEKIGIAGGIHIKSEKFLFGKDYDLCESCAQAFELFMKEERMESEGNGSRR